MMYLPFLYASKAVSYLPCARVLITYRQSEMEKLRTASIASSNTPGRLKKDLLRSKMLKLDRRRSAFCLASRIGVYTRSALVLAAVDRSDQLIGLEIRDIIHI